ncbi:MAG: cupin domain-containing protein [Phycisphaerales bacterium]|nr:cupin domain-containing protein [Phycisphaerales bacterium]
MSTENPHPDAAELAALFAAGALSPDERAKFEAMLADADSGCAKELQALSPAVEALSDAAGPVAAPKSVRDALLRRTREQSPQATAESFYIQRDNQGEWKEFGIPGARMRTLFVDRERMVKTFLLQMAPGCEIPSHPHDDVEECYVIEGDLHTADTVLRPGDYMRAPAGSLHGRSFTQGGCLMLVTAGVDEHELN